MFHRKKSVIQVWNNMRVKNLNFWVNYSFKQGCSWSLALPSSDTLVWKFLVESEYLD